MFVIALSPLIVIPDKASSSVCQTIIEAVLEKVAASGKWL
jgi:hypothetical protein